jgi:hypothetical protein
MTSRRARKTTRLMPLLFVSLAALAAGCSTDSGTKKAGSIGPTGETGYLSAADGHEDPGRIICRHYKPTGSRVTEKICMTARQWNQAGEDTAPTLDRGTDGQ